MVLQKAWASPKIFNELDFLAVMYVSQFQFWQKSCQGWICFARLRSVEVPVCLFVITVIIVTLFRVENVRREWLPNLPSQGLVAKTHNYLQYYQIYKYDYYLECIYKRGLNVLCLDLQHFDVSVSQLNRSS